VFEMIRDLDPTFTVPGSGFLPALYNGLGFRKAAILLRIRRFFMWPLNMMGIGLGQ
jgi:hypothetical protein